MAAFNPTGSYGSANAYKPPTAVGGTGVLGQQPAGFNNGGVSYDNYQTGMQNFYPTLGNDALPGIKKGWAQPLAQQLGYTGGFGGGQFQNWLNQNNLKPAWQQLVKGSPTGMAQAPFNPMGGVQPSSTMTGMGGPVATATGGLPAGMQPGWGLVGTPGLGPWNY